MVDHATAVDANTGAPQGIELRHLRYFVALAEAGSFTRAAAQVFIAQPTLSQQIRRLEELVGTQLLQRRRDGVRLTKAGMVLLDAARNVLSLVDHGVSRTKQAAGLGRQHMRVVVPPRLPDALAAGTVSALRSAAATADVDIVWIETPLDAEFSLIRQHRADAGLGWLTDGPAALPAPLDAMSLGELAAMDVIHGPRQAEPGTYEAWASRLRAADPRFAFTDPPFRHSLPTVLAFAVTSDRPTAVLTGPVAVTGAGRDRSLRVLGAHDMVRVSIKDQPLTAAAALVWNTDLPRPLQQILVDTAFEVTAPALSGVG